MTRQEVGRVSQRAQMILLSAQRRTVPEIAHIFDVEDKTVRKWLRRFAAGGPAGLYDAPRCGRPRKLTESIRAVISRAIIYQAFAGNGDHPFAGDRGPPIRARTGTTRSRTIGCHAARQA